MPICAAHVLAPRSPIGFGKGIWPVFIESVNREHTVSKLLEGSGYGTGLYFKFSVSTVQSWPEPRAPQNHPIPIPMVTEVNLFIGRVGTQLSQ